MTFSRALIGFAALALSAGAALAEAATLRIEPRSYTSAVVTIENGVRVWRPLPPTDRVIINPNNAASINLELDMKPNRSDRSFNYNLGPHN